VCLCLALSFIFFPSLEFQLVDKGADRRLQYVRPVVAALDELRKIAAVNADIVGNPLVGEFVVIQEDCQACKVIILRPREEIDNFGEVWLFHKCLQDGGLRGKDCFS